MRLEIIIIDIVDNFLNEFEVRNIGNFDEYAVMVVNVHKVDCTFSEEEEEFFPKVAVQ